MDGEEGQGDLLHDVEDGCQDCSASRRGHRVEGQVISGDREYQRLLDSCIATCYFKATIAICNLQNISSVTCEMLDACVGQWCTLQEERPGQAASRLCKHSGRSL